MNPILVQSTSEPPRSITAYPLLHAANKEIENGAILRPKVQPKLDIAHQSYQHFPDKRVWVEQQLHEDGLYTTYSWAYDASKKLGDEWRTGQRPIIVAEGFAVKGDHPNLPVTEELMEQIHQTSLPQLRAFFPLTLEQWDPRRKAGGHHTDLTFEILASVPPGQTLVPEDAIGHLPTHDFIAEAKLVKELDARLAKPNAKHVSTHYQAHSRAYADLGEDVRFSASDSERQVVPLPRIKEVELLQALKIKLSTLECRNEPDLTNDEKAALKAEFDIAAAFLSSLRARIQGRCQRLESTEERSKKRRGGGWPNLFNSGRSSPSPSRSDSSIDNLVLEDSQKSQLLLLCDEMAELQASTIGYPEKQRAVIDWHKTAYLARDIS